MNAYLCAVADSTVLAYAATAERARELAALAAGQPVRRCDYVPEHNSAGDREGVFRARGAMEKSTQ